MKNRQTEVPYAPEIFRTIPIIELDGKAIPVPVRLTREPAVKHHDSPVLHITIKPGSHCTRPN